MSPAVLRILDANHNRAREALRVLEDYARFALNDKARSQELKDLRHALESLNLPDAILHRDTPGDVGTGNKAASELSRMDLANVVTAAGKRLGEALRTIEEYLKIEAPELAAQAEKARYRFYDIEMRLALTLCGAEGFARVSLYVLITESACKRHWRETAVAAIAGGADCLQLREKDLDGGELLARASELVRLCRKNNVMSIINDRADIALLADADGVHVGQTDLLAADARKIIGRQKLLGVSTHNIEQAQQAVADGADYIGVGPVFVSPTKPREFLPGLAFAKQVVQEISIPAVAIAGINEANLDEVLATGVRAVAVTSAIAGVDDPEAATRRMKEKIMSRKAG